MNLHQILAKLDTEEPKFFDLPTVGLSAPLRKSVEEYSSIAIGAISGKPAPAQWIVDRNEYVKQYKQSVYIAVGAIARKVAMQEARCYIKTESKSGTKLEPLGSGDPLTALLQEPNPLYTQYEMWYHTIGWRLITGDAFWWIAYNGFDLPAEIWPLPSQWVWAVPSKTKFIEGYLVRGFFSSDTFLDESEVVHLKEPSLDWSGTGRFYGKPPLAALAVHADLENTILSRLYHEFKNFAPPGLHYETDAELTRDQVNDIFNQIVNQHSLSEQTGLPIVTHSGLKAKEFTSGRREISYLESLNYLLEFTLAVYGVPKAVVGLVADTNRANMMAALMAFCENTINPLLVSIAQVLTRDIAAQFDERCIVKFDPCSVEDAQRIREDILVASRVGAVTPNEVREVLLGKGPYNVGGNKPYIMAGMLEAAMGNGQPVAEKYEQEAREVEGEQDEECDLFEIANGKVQIKNRDRFRDYFARQGLANGSNFTSNGKNGL